MLRKRALTNPTDNSHAVLGESKEEQKMSLEEMAFKVDLSESRMRVLFKSQVGLPPTRYAIKVRMEDAAKRLRDSYERVTEIAAGSGFNSDSYFARAFKKVYGMTPTQYRKLHQRPSEGIGEEENGAPSSR